jgi:hypothetical protein
MTGGWACSLALMLLTGLASEVLSSSTESQPLRAVVLHQSTGGAAVVIHVQAGEQRVLNAERAAGVLVGEAIITGSGRLDWLHWSGWQGAVTLQGLELLVPPALPEANLSG